jgi:hypothetical protein
VTTRSETLFMSDKTEKEKRKQILYELRKKAREEFENSLPMGSDNFKKLFDYLDAELSSKTCDDTNVLTKGFLLQHNINNVDEVLEWLANQGGYCDCEILANVEEQFE